MPQPTRTWFPLSHAHVVQNVVSRRRGRLPGREGRYALSRGDARLFAVLDPRVHAGLGDPGRRRAQQHRQEPAGSASAWSRCFVCDNLCFRGEIVIARKHTRFGDARFIEALARA